MKAFLMHRDRDVDLKSELPLGAEAVIQDLDLDTLLAAMAAEGEFLWGVARRAVLSASPIWTRSSTGSRSLPTPSPSRT